MPPHIHSPAFSLCMLSNLLLLFWFLIALLDLIKNRVVQLSFGTLLILPGSSSGILTGNYLTDHESSLFPDIAIICLEKPLVQPACQLLPVLIFLYKRHHKPDDGVEVGLGKLFVRSQTTKHVDEPVVNRIFLGGQLGEEKLAHVNDCRIFIHVQLGHLCQLALDLDLAGQNQECHSHETRSLNHEIRILEAAIEIILVCVDYAVEANRHVT